MRNTEKTIKSNAIGQIFNEFVTEQNTTHVITGINLAEKALLMQLQTNIAVSTNPQAIVVLTNEFNQVIAFTKQLKKVVTKIASASSKVQIEFLKSLTLHPQYQKSIHWLHPNNTKLSRAIVKEYFMAPTVKQNIFRGLDHLTTVLQFSKSVLNSKM